MREYIGASDIANQVSMLRSVHSGAVILVEGVTDRRLYGKMVDPEECEIIVCHSKDNVRLASRELYYKRKDRKLIGIMDADMDRLRENVPSPPLFLTDTRDAEMMMISSCSFEEVLWEYGEEDKIESFVKTHGDIRDAVLDASYPLGLLMYVSSENDLGLSFKDLDYSRFVDPVNLKTDIRNMVDEVTYNSHSPSTNRKHIRNLLVKEMEFEYDPWIVCRGHDAVAIVLIGLKKIFGGYNSRNMKCGELGGALRLAFDMNDFKATELFRQTSEWAASNEMILWITDLP